MTSKILWGISQYHKNNKISSIAMCPYDNPKTPFFTCGDDDKIFKWYFRGDNYVNENYIEVPEARFTAIALHPKYQNCLYIGDYLGRVIVLDINSKKILKQFRVANEAVSSFGFSKNFENLITIGYSNGMIMMYYNGVYQATITNEKKETEKFKSFCYFSDDNTLIYKEDNNNLLVSQINFINNKTIFIPKDQVNYRKIEIIDIQLHPSEKYLGILLSNNRIDLRDVDDIRNTLGVIYFGDDNFINGFCFDISGKFMLVATDEFVKVVDVTKAGQELTTIEVKRVNLVRVAENGRHVILFSKDGAMLVCENDKVVKGEIFDFRDREVQEGKSVWNSFTIPKFPDEKRNLDLNCKKAPKRNFRDKRSENTSLCEESVQSEEESIKSGYRGHTHYVEEDPVKESVKNYFSTISNTKYFPMNSVPQLSRIPKGFYSRVSLSRNQVELMSRQSQYSTRLQNITNAINTLTSKGMFSDEGMSKDSSVNNSMRYINNTPKRKVYEEKSDIDDVGDGTLRKSLNALDNQDENLSMGSSIEDENKDSVTDDIDYIEKII